MAGHETFSKNSAYRNIQTSHTMAKPDNKVAVRTLVMAAVLAVGLVAFMLAKGLLHTAALAS